MVDGRINGSKFHVIFVLCMQLIKYPLEFDFLVNQIPLEIFVFRISMRACGVGANVVNYGGVNIRSTLFRLKAVAEGASNVSPQFYVCVLYLLSLLFCNVVWEVVVQIFDLVHDCS